MDKPKRQRGRTVPEPEVPTQAIWTDNDLIESASARTPIEIAAVRWAASTYGGNDWLAYETDEPDSGMASEEAFWVVAVGRISWPDNKSIWVAVHPSSEQSYQVCLYADVSSSTARDSLIIEALLNLKGL